MPLIKIMCNPGLKDRHWDKITDIIGAKLRGDMDIKLNTLIVMRVSDHIKALDEISDTA
jgi:dynein heavy chain